MTEAVAGSTAAPADERVPEVTVEELARKHAVVRPGGWSGGVVHRWIVDLADRLDDAVEGLVAAPPTVPRARATEWLLDNTHLLSESLGHAEEALPRAFLRRLPRLSDEGHLRASALSRWAVEWGRGFVDPEEVMRAVQAYQRETPLTIGELWALPSLLRSHVLARLVEAAEQLLPPASGSRPHRTSEPEAAADMVATCVRSVRTLDAHDWKRFFEATSLVEAVLRRDPAGAYSRMDFATRDRYRATVERIARDTEADERAVAETAITLAERSPAADPRRRHVGYHLVDDGRTALEAAVGARVGALRRLRRGAKKAAPFLYFGGVAVGTLAALAVLLLGASDATVLQIVLALILALVPASAVAVAAVNWLATRLVRPRRLPKLEVESPLPPELATMVVVPALLSGPEEVDELVAQLELNYRANPLEGVRFALLADFTDAPRESMPTDRAFLQRARTGVEKLNRRYGRNERGPFLLLHRGRRWNPAEGCWMGWERKRGKLEAFNRMVLGLDNELTVEVGRLDDVRRARFALTLDADTFLPQAAAGQLIGALGHPLNAPAVDDAGRVVAGYTVLQPRVETTPSSAGATLFARIFQGERGLDLYSHAVSDVYQDLFGKGIYAGKGIYHVEAFERSLRGRVPEDRILSHDLFEGEHGRVGLVSDVVVLEDYPSHPLTFVRRLHRWVRGDWQLLPWLFPRVPAAEGGWRANPIGLLGRWKIADNLRRSLLWPSVLLLLIAGWTVLPSPAWWWTAAGLGVPAVPLLLAALEGARFRVRRPSRWILLIRTPASLALGLGRWAVSVMVLPYRALAEIDAVVRTLVRLLLTRRKLLEWSSAAHVARTLGGSGHRATWKAMALSPALAVLMGGATAVWRPAALPVAAPLLLLWILAPVGAHVLGRPRRRREKPLTREETLRLGALARRTWAFFERFLSPEFQWLPPDHHQERPDTGPVYRSSPTNVGLGGLSVLAAHDLGYLPVSRMCSTLGEMLGAMEALERYRGHFLNWYDTRHRTPLAPRYVSTVDSGNLAASLVTLARGCEAVARAPVPDPRRELEALTHALEVVRESAVRLARRADGRVDIRAFQERVEALKRDLGGGVVSSRRWAELLVHVGSEAVSELESSAVDLVEQAARTGRVASGAELRVALQHLRRQLQWQREELERLAPWLLPSGSTTWKPVAHLLPDVVSPAKAAERLRPALAALESLEGDGERSAGETRAALSAAVRHAAVVTRELGDIAGRCDALVSDMDFAFLYDPQRRIFHVGYDVDSGRLDGARYDLLASEARLASLIAIAEGQVPQEHWLHLGRPFSRAGGRGVLLSWGGTMFEYLLPDLLLRSPEPSLLRFANEAAVDRQKAFGRRWGIPWGVSESAYHRLDRHGTYQYRAFGVPDLAIRRDVGERVVVAPYASLLALRSQARAVLRNLEHLVALDGLGMYGLYEALDFGNVPVDGGRPHVVRSWMAHHQGMILVALANFLREDIMVERFHSDPRIASVELLLHERVPGKVPASARRPRLRPARRARGLPPRVGSWTVPRDWETHQAHVLSNGRWSTLVTDRGGGGARWDGRALTRWRADPLGSPSGPWIHLQDLDDATWWPLTGPPEPAGGGAPLREVTFAPDRADFRCAFRGVTARLTVAVAPVRPTEIRRLRLVNDGDRTRRLGVTSYGEVVLAPHGEDRRHPAFTKLFVESAWLPQADTLMFHRRQGAAGARPLHLAHTVVGDTALGPVGWETDRGRFLGRTRVPGRPAGLAEGPRSLEGTVGATLDPVFALGCEIELPPFGEATLVFLTSAGRTADDALSALEPFRTPGRVDWALAQGAERARIDLHEAGLAPEDAASVQRLLTAVVYPYHALRRAPGAPSLERPVQPELWGQGISGDVPVVLLRISDPDQLPAAEEVLRAHGWLFRCGVEADLVVLDEGSGGYEDPVGSWVRGAVARHHGAEWLGRTGGLHHIPGGRLDTAARAALSDAAALVIDMESGGLAEHLTRLDTRGQQLPPFIPTPHEPPETMDTAPLPSSEGLTAFNGLGGFTPDGREYVIRLEPGSDPPAPWINVIANPRFGFTVSERGTGFTWSGNSSEHRLTPWNNDPVEDRPGEALYLRDEETGDIWTPTPGPAPAPTAYEVRHGAGYTSFRHHSHGLAQELRLFVPPDAPVKVVRLELTNLSDRQRRLTATYYAEWVLGNHRDVTAPHVRTELAARDAAVLARQTFAAAYASRVAFLASSETLHGATGDRLEFLGGPGGLADPAALRRVGLGQRFGTGHDPCAAVQLHVDLPPGRSRTVHFVLGEGETRDDALAWVRRFRDPDEVESAWQASHDFWESFLGRIEVATPDTASDILVNRWLPYQALVCRLWGRSALYQSGGAFGFRDQLQDALSLLHREPGLAREHVLEAARHQFVEGDVLHWWHPGGEEGVRTRCSDDFLWLPYVTAAYVMATGDEEVLGEMVPFLEAPPLAEGERERYERFPESPEHRTLYIHCLRALERVGRPGPHGLPLIGTGDWNDGMDRVGEGGRGESVWLGWFLHTVLTSFVPLCERTGDLDQARVLTERAEALAKRVEAAGWDGGWYRRAYFDDGTPLGSAANDEGRIDSLTQSWAALSGAADPDRVRQALDAVTRELVREEDRLVLLLAPPFDRTPLEPGYIKAYPPGVRENGGQYTHAAVWVAWAFATLGDGETAASLFRLLNPVLRSDTPEGAALYRVEPYVVAADVYGVPPHTGRGGWTWYTGSSGWLQRLWLEAILGVRPVEGGVKVAPCIPPSWPGYQVTLRSPGGELHIEVENPDGGSTRVAEAALDGTPIPASAVVPLEDGRHRLRVRLGRG